MSLKSSCAEEKQTDREAGSISSTPLGLVILVTVINFFAPSTNPSLESLRRIPQAGFRSKPNARRRESHTRPLYHIFPFRAGVAKILVAGSPSPARFFVYVDFLITILRFRASLESIVSVASRRPVFPTLRLSTFASRC